MDEIFKIPNIINGIRVLIEVKKFWIFNSTLNYIKHSFDSIVIAFYMPFINCIFQVIYQNKWKGYLIISSYINALCNCLLKTFVFYLYCLLDKCTNVQWYIAIARILLIWLLPGKISKSIKNVHRTNRSQLIKKKTES